MSSPESPFNILFTSAGRRVSLVRCFRRALDALGLPGQIVTADMKKTAPAPFVADARELVPRVSDPGYLDRLKAICRRHHIRLLVPLIDSELLLLATHRAEFEELGARVLVSTPETTRLSMDKRLTYSFFKEHGISTPELLDPVALLADPQSPFPVLLKPADGSGSSGVTRIGNARELRFFLEYVPNPLVQELVVGDEYTLDALVDFRGAVRCVVPRLRIETRAGEVSKGMTVKDPAIIAAGKRLVEALPGAVGCITVQCFSTPPDGLKFIEVNPRFGGGFPLSAHAGADFPRWIIEMALGRDPAIALDGWRDGVVMLRYDDAIFVDRGSIA